MHKAFSILLIIALILASLPAYHPADSNQDRRVDLKDSIIRLKEFAQSAQEKGKFSAQLKKALQTLSVVSGATTLVDTNQAADFQLITPQLDLICLLQKDALHFRSKLQPLNEILSIDYTSINTPLDPRPPCLFLS